ncbi:phage tail sheath C-terminal domain-containing protein [Paenibacillus thailandensis]|uniref:Phage tail sheath C-terminal domain-containing protein n=1 Tax=Paenibacillus thailandensis TaxID=393250 RepID=A0ABW5R314_9BACL
MAIGLPIIDINFSKLAVTAITRSSQQIAALIIKEATASVQEFTSALALADSIYTDTNVQYIKDVLSGGCSKVIVVAVASSSENVVADAITALGYRKFNWIALAEGTAEEQSDLVTYVKEQEALKKGIWGVVFNVTAPDCQHIVNFTNNNVKYKTGTTATGDKFVTPILGLQAGLPLTQSSTYYVFNELESVIEPANVETAINNGEFVLFNDDEQVRVGRGVNSLTTLSNGVTDDFKKIVIVRTIDLIRADIQATFKNDYVGKYKNSYDNQVLFISAINSYLADLASEGILDRNYNNVCYVDVEAQRAAWVDSGKTEALGWTDVEVRNNTFGSNLYLAGQIKILDAIEDLKFDITMA